MNAIRNWSETYFDMDNKKIERNLNVTGDRRLQRDNRGSVIDRERDRIVCLRSPSLSHSPLNGVCCNSLSSEIYMPLRFVWANSFDTFTKDLLEGYSSSVVLESKTMHCFAEKYVKFENRPYGFSEKISPLAYFERKLERKIKIDALWRLWLPNFAREFCKEILFAIF